MFKLWFEDLYLNHTSRLTPYLAWYLRSLNLNMDLPPGYYGSAKLKRPPYELEKARALEIHSREITEFLFTGI